ncbi:YheC/YheD family protein [Paenibacillus sp. P96]|uniref:YheC/YheD family protein n=1 Tax=Paenibacillus zeirhizosphaerae TaxID=2987519 RepID=A0ABT9FT34_9BACL|nr:YheC/YheD family protein [Paenibacillus sp. P96]MDP4097896.1 YheC/YheD family protein [Paenibacillus sp. P96]
MSKKKITVQVMGSGILQDDVLMVGEKLLKQLKLQTGYPVQLVFGAFRQQMTAISVPRYDGIRLGSGIAYSMGILSDCALRMQYNPRSRTLRLGPLISVLISRDYPGQYDKPFGKITQFCRELSGACGKQGAFVYFFTPEHISGNASRVEGWVYSNGWRKATLPAADVVNNRLTSRKLENKPSVQHFMKEVKSRYGSHVFNEKFLDKHEVFDALKGSSALRRYLPESHLLENFAVFKRMCGLYSQVFIKPVRGSLGKGIIRINKNADGSFTMLTTTTGTPLKQTYPNVTKMFAGLSGKMRSTRFQIQQGLTLIHHNMRPVDFRALVQKNSSGAWSVTSVVARIAGGSHFVSNLARGGTLSTVKDAVAKTTLSATAKANAPNKLKAAALQIAAGIDHTIPAHFGELGIDLAIDSSGRIWLIEVNSKPSKNDNTPLGDVKTRPSVLRMLEYSCHLTGF